MCGIAGFFRPTGFKRETGAQTVADMTQQLRARGPDALAHWCDPEAGIALGHARLSVIELSQNGAQPMASSSGRFILVFNGEIYNHLELREALLSRFSKENYRGHSDTETLLAGFECWGVRETLSKAVGMFSFALWDRQDRRLSLGRDRFGEKPLFFGWQGEGPEASLLFGSEIKALHAHPAFERRLDRDSAIRYFERHCVPGTASIFEGINKIEPGSVLTFDTRSREATKQIYWDISAAVSRGAENRFQGGNEALLEQMDDLLFKAVKRQMLSDVPLGAFLSGGVDSSSIVAQMCRVSSAPVKTFTIGFSEPRFDESAHAAAVAKHLGTDHTKLEITTSEAQAVIPDLCNIYDEPFADVSQIPTCLVSRLAREHVTVSLTGDGADEFFAGYSRYEKTLRSWRMRNRVPAALWSVLAPASRTLEKATSASARLAKLNRVARVAGQFDAKSLARYYASTSNFNRSQPVTLRAGAALPLPESNAQSDLETLCEYDVHQYMRDDILVKVDRAAMAVSLETRSPFLDHEVVEFAFSLPPRMKQHVRDGQIKTKWPLRQLLYRYVPEALIERPKMGFGVPIEDWLREGLEDWAASYLMDEKLGEDGLLDARMIQKLWNDHKARRADNGAVLWAVVMFCAWREKWL